MRKLRLRMLIRLVEAAADGAVIGLLAGAVLDALWPP